MNLGNRMRTERKSRGWTLKYVAEALGLPQLSTYSNWEYGRREPDTEMLGKIAELYQLSIDALLGNSEQKNVPEKIRDVKTIEDFFKLVSHKSDHEILDNFQHLYYQGEKLDRETVKKLISYARFLINSDNEQPSP